AAGVAVWLEVAAHPGLGGAPVLGAVQPATVEAAQAIGGGAAVRVEALAAEAVGAGDPALVADRVVVDEMESAVVVGRVARLLRTRPPRQHAAVAPAAVLALPGRPAERLRQLPLAQIAQPRVARLLVVRAFRVAERRHREGRSVGSEFESELRLRDAPTAVDE